MQASKRARFLDSRNNNEALVSVLSVLPVCVGVIVLMLLPGLAVVLLGFKPVTLGVGRGYIEALNDPDFRRSFGKSIEYAFLTVPIQIALGIFAAVWVHRVREGWRVRTLFLMLFLPYAIPSVAAVLVWNFMIRDHGALAAAGAFLSVPRMWLASDGLFWTLCIVSVWQFFPFVYVTVLARMRRIPAEQYQMAEIDGATRWQQFIWITWPEIRSAVAAIAIVRIAFMFTKFDTPWLLGGAGSTYHFVETVPLWVYRKLSTVNEPAEAIASAGASMMAIFILVCIGALLWLFRNRTSRRALPHRKGPCGKLAAGLVASARGGIIMFCIVPFGFLLLGSFLPSGMLDRGIGCVCATSWTFQNYRQLFSLNYGEYGLHLGITVIVSLAAAVLVLSLCIPGAYAITRFVLPVEKPLRGIALWGYLFPPVLLVIPYSKMARLIGSHGTPALAVLILANVALCLPFGLWLMTQYFEAVPMEYDHSAAVDGAGHFRTLISVLVPRALPGISAVAIFTFILSWNDVLLSLYLVPGHLRTLASYADERVFKAGNDQSQYGEFAVASVIIAGTAIFVLGWALSSIDRWLCKERQGVSG